MPAGNAAAYDRLAEFFIALGFAPGKGWQEEGSRGASFLAPLGNLEFVDGRFPSTADVLIEVTSLDSIHQAAEAWLRVQAGEATGESAQSRLSPITETHWRSRFFTVEPEPGFRFSFWAWSDPLKGKPVALEGDLSAAGMKFAIVVARWNAVVTDRLLDGALDALLRSGADRSDIEVVRVPGAWEIPAAARTLANAGRADAIVTLGCLFVAKPLTTRPSTTKSRAASASRSRKPASRTASAYSPAKISNKPSTAPASRLATRALRQQSPPSRWSSLRRKLQQGGPA